MDVQHVRHVYQTSDGVLEVCSVCKTPFPCDFVNEFQANQDSQLTARLSQFVDKVVRIRQLHTPFKFTVDSGEVVVQCNECDSRYPCQTVAILGEEFVS